jgi:polar amino acid transport system permease protein
VLTWNQFSRIAFDGGIITISVFVGAAVLGTVLSLFFGIMGLSESRLFRSISRVYVEVTRGASAIVLVFFAAFALPRIIGFRTSDVEVTLFGVDVGWVFIAGVVALGLNMGGYGAEVVRGGIQSISRGQTEASISLSLTSAQRLRHVILPQAVMTMLPPYGNLNIEVMKGTALVSLIGVADMTFLARGLRNRRVILLQEGLEPPSVAVIFGTALVLYFIISQAIAAFYRWQERRFGGRWYGGGQ